jgi:uncharacterized membrane protein (UPF0127 family)
MQRIYLILTAIVATIIIVGVVIVVLSSASPPLSSFKVESLEIINPSGNSTISGLAYVASDSSEQAQGFQNVNSFGDCNGHTTDNITCIGMIFVFTSEQSLCFWMHNTILPLQQVWISGNGTVTAIFQAMPENDKVVCHSGMYVLETSPTLRILVGDTIRQNST